MQERDEVVLRILESMYKVMEYLLEDNEWRSRKVAKEELDKIRFYIENGRN